MMQVSRRAYEKDTEAGKKIDTLFYTRTVEAMCMKDLLFDLIIGNVQQLRKLND